MSKDLHLAGSVLAVSFTVAPCICVVLVHETYIHMSDKQME